MKISFQPGDRVVYTGFDNPGHNAIGTFDWLILSNNKTTASYEEAVPGFINDNGEGLIYSYNDMKGAVNFIYTNETNSKTNN
jgi:hypothetical protein